MLWSEGNRYIVAGERTYDNRSRGELYDVIVVNKSYGSS